MKFVLLVGIPGSGKSTAATALINAGYACFNADHIREEIYGDATIQGRSDEVFGLMYDRMELALKEKKDIVIDNTNVRKANRRSLIAIARQYGYTDIELWLFETPLEVCIQQNNSRARVVPEEIIVEMDTILTENRPFLEEEGKVIRIIHPSNVSGEQ